MAPRRRPRERARIRRAVARGRPTQRPSQVRLEPMASPQARSRTASPSPSSAAAKTSAELRFAERVLILGHRRQLRRVDPSGPSTVRSAAARPPDRIVPGGASEDPGSPPTRAARHGLGAALEKRHRPRACEAVETRRWPSAPSRCEPWGAKDAFRMAGRAPASAGGRVEPWPAAATALGREPAPPAGRPARRPARPG
jgi:hypothetical protein